MYRRVECPELVEGQFCFYILECNEGSLYSGFSKKLKKRLLDHVQGRAAEWTKIRRPVQLVYYEVYSTHAEARMRELQIKGWTRNKKENLIIGKWGKQ